MWLRRNIGWVVLATSVLLALMLYGAVFSQSAAVPSDPTSTFENAASHASPETSQNMPAPAGVSNVPARVASPGTATSLTPGAVAPTLDTSPARSGQQPVPRQPVYKAVQTANGPQISVAQPPAALSPAPYRVTPGYPVQTADGRQFNVPQRTTETWGPSAYQPAPRQQLAVQTADGLQGVVVQPAGSYAPFDLPFKAVQTDPELAEIALADEAKGREVLELVKQYKAAAGESPRAEAREKLEALVNEHFDIRQKQRELEISRLEERLEKIRAALEKRNEARQLIVDRHIAELLGLGDDLAF